MDQLDDYTALYGGIYNIEIHILYIIYIFIEIYIDCNNVIFHILTILSMLV